MIFICWGAANEELIGEQDAMMETLADAEKWVVFVPGVRAWCPCLVFVPGVRAWCCHSIITIIICR